MTSNVDDVRPVILDLLFPELPATMKDDLVRFIIGCTDYPTADEALRKVPINREQNIEKYDRMIDDWVRTAPFDTESGRQAMHHFLSLAAVGYATPLEMSMTRTITTAITTMRGMSR